ncbi:MAG: hypothetical protein ABIP03_04335 [Aquihabitans sp.]
MVEPKLGKDALLDAASLLFDELGVDAVSLNRINEASGHKNRSAVTYHFGGKFEVVKALVERSASLPDAVRGALLDKVERDHSEPGPRVVLEALIGPMSQQLETPEGRRHLRLLGHISGHPEYLSATQNLAYAAPNLARCSLHLARHLEHLPHPLQLERVALIGGFIVRSYAGQARLLTIDDPPRPVLSVDDFTTNLLDLLLALLLADSTLAT